ncbi:MAG TPA: sulfotransferase [Candidatus Limnocylindrales bacterium]|nr:sulfotransferase [Candidatus Limnocylindrales bacterium]
MALRLPGFIHVGPPRTGTTWMHEVLMGHVGLPSIKETRFFDVSYERGAEWYCNLFGDYPADVPAGEMGPTYFSNAIARERIKQHIPDCKIIVTFREPAARLYSLYRLIRSERRPVEDTFDGYWRFQIHCGADLCSYATHLKRWQATFGKSRVLVLFYEDLNSNPQGYLDTVCDFVGARRIALDRSGAGVAKVYSAPTAARSNLIARRTVEAVDWAARHGARRLIEFGQRTPLWKIVRRPFVEDFPPLSNESAEEIRAMMVPEIEELERMTGRNLSRWKPAAQRKLDDARAPTSAAGPSKIRYQR